MDYLATIEQFFVVLRRSGLMLSAQDVSLVEAWREAGVPVDAVCRGLARGAERYRASHGSETRLPHTLRFYRRDVEEALRERRADVPITPTEPGPAQTGDPLAELAYIGRSETDPRRRDAYRAAWRAMRAAGELHDPSARDAALDAADAAAVDCLLGSLTPAERAVIDEAVDELLAKERPALGVHGARVRRRAILEDELTRRFSLVRLREGIE